MQLLLCRVVMLVLPHCVPWPNFLRLRDVLTYVSYKKYSFHASSVFFPTIRLLIKPCRCMEDMATSRIIRSSNFFEIFVYTPYLKVSEHQFKSNLTIKNHTCKNLPEYWISTLYRILVINVVGNYIEYVSSESPQYVDILGISWHFISLEEINGVNGV